MDEEKNEKIDQEIPVPEETVATSEVPQEVKTEEAFDASTFTPTSRRSKKKKKKNPILKILTCCSYFGWCLSLLYLFLKASFKGRQRSDCNH